jgi:hypothetical protein
MVTKFGIVFLALLAVVGVGSWVRGKAIDRAREDPMQARNERLTALNGAVLYVLLVAVVATVFDISGLLPEHYLVGFLLIPPVALKLGSIGYRFIRYYARDPSYSLAGTPPLLLRFVVAPILVVATVVVFATGIELWAFGLRYGSGWMEAHTLSAVIMVLATAPHVLAHLRRSGAVLREEVISETRDRLSGRALVVAGLLLGAALAAASLLYSSPFPPSAAGG